MRTTYKVISAAALICSLLVSCTPDAAPDDAPDGAIPSIPIISDVEVTGVTLDKTSAELEVESELTLVATVKPSNASNKKVTWTSSDDAIATVANGKVTAVSVGKATITVKTKDGNKTASCEITVKPKPIVHVTGVTLDKTTAEAEVGPYVEYLTLNPTVLPENATDKSVTWSSSNTNIAKVSSSGMVSIYKTGTVVITVTTVDGEKTASCTITIKDKPVVKVTGVQMYYKTRTVKVGDIFDIAATVSPGNALNRSVTWTPSPAGLIESYSGVYTYQSMGNTDVLYRAKAVGNVTITVKTIDGGFTDTCEVTITE